VAGIALGDAGVEVVLPQTDPVAARGIGIPGVYAVRIRTAVFCAAVTADAADGLQAGPTRGEVQIGGRTAAGCVTGVAVAVEHVVAVAVVEIGVPRLAVGERDIAAGAKVPMALDAAVVDGGAHVVPGVVGQPLGRQESRREHQHGCMGEERRSASRLHRLCSFGTLLRMARSSIWEIDPPRRLDGVMQISYRLNPAMFGRSDTPACSD
jgi:hypothetical protein